MRIFLLALALLLATAPAFAHHPTKNQYTLQVENHSFTPQRLEVPADTPFKLIIGNNADHEITFASDAAGLSKTVPADGAAVINVPPLAANHYAFTVSGYPDTGVMIAIAHQE